MRKTTLALIAAAGLGFGAVQTASAADMGRPVYKAAPAPVATAYNWSGFYVGGHVGYSWASQDDNLFGTGLEPDGFLAGGQVGYNWQADRWVFGIEGDMSWSNADDSKTFGGVPFTVEHNWYATATARVGYAWDAWLLYAKGGAAFIDRDFTVAGLGISSGTDTGWTVGGGLEWALAPQWSAKVEYNYMNFEGDTIAAPFVTNTDSDIHMVKVGLNYRFGGGYGKGPIAARY